MKSPTPLFILLVLLATVPLGCGKNESVGDAGGASASGSPMPAVDLSKLEGAFASATGTVKTEFDKAVAAIKSADYAGALTKLQELAGNASLSDEQKSALSDLLAQVKAKTGDLMKTAGDAAGKAVDQAKEAASKAAAQAAEAASKAADKASDAASKAANDLRPK